MEKDEIIESIKSYGKVAYVAQRGARVSVISDPSLSTPRSLVGGITHRLENDDWPIFKDKPYIPVLQISKNDLPLFEEVFGPDIQMIAFYCPEYADRPIDSMIIEEGKDDKWPALFKEYLLQDPLKPLLIPQGVPQEEEIYLIEWKSNKKRTTKRH